MRSFLRHHFKLWHSLFTRKCEREYSRLLLLFGDKERFKPLRVKFLEYEVNVPDSASFLSQFKEIYLDECYRFEATDAAPRIYDCGANIGMSCLYFKQLFPDASVRAFEADPGIMDYLRRNLESNGVRDVECVQKAVWVHDRGVEFQPEGADGGSIVSGGQAVKMESVRLKDELEREQAIDLLKIDIEGAEIEVLRDCSNSLGQVRNVFVEYHSFSKAPQHLHEVLGILAGNGFRYFVESTAPRKSPFINRRLDRQFDLQVNVFAYRMPDAH